MFPTPTVPIQHAFALAVQHHQAGRLGEAEALYRQILSVQPSHAEALHLLGVVAHQVGRHDEAVRLIGQAIAIAPNNAAAHSNLGEACRSMNLLDEAEASYHRAIKVNSEYLAAHYNLANALRHRGRLDDAIAEYRRAIQLKPDHLESNNNLGMALARQGQLDEAIAAYRRALEINPDFHEAHNNLGNALCERGQFEEGVAAYRRALELRPELAEIHNNVGNARRQQGRMDEAVQAYRQALQLKADYAEVYCNLGFALVEQGRLDEAGENYRRARQLQPNSDGAKLNYSMLLLLRGDFAQGWPLYEFRWEALQYAERRFAQPRWDGSILDGQRVLLHAEQGFGDTIQFIRYAPLVVQRGGRVIVECQPELKPLLAGMEGVSQVLEHGEPLPAFDLHCPMVSLPLTFGTRVETIPAPIPYLKADPIKAARWRERLDRETNLTGDGSPSRCRPLKVGLIWAGGIRPHQPSANLIDQRRSMRLSQFGPLAGVPGVVFVSLQKGAPAAQAQTPPEGMTLLDWTEELHDFADTAALVEALDLVIGVDTAGVHLAGALGKPVWVLNRFDACWRWLRDRTDSPWYPTMRLFRQSTAGDWTTVIAEARAHLQTLVQAHPSP